MCNMPSVRNASGSVIAPVLTITLNHLTAPGVRNLFAQHARTHANMPANDFAACHYGGDGGGAGAHAGVGEVRENHRVPGASAPFVTSCA